MSARLFAWRAGPPNPELERAMARLARADDVVQLAIMPDAHVAEDVCVGAVTATTWRLIPAAVGGDIGCGMTALALGVDAARLGSAETAAQLLTDLARLVPALVHPVRTAPRWPECLDAALSAPRLEALKREARRELGTLGRGNHFLELQRDDAKQLWLMVHSGSRCMGPAIRRHHEATAEPDAEGFLGFAADSERGAAYLADMQWATHFAACNRACIVAAACALLRDRLGAEPDHESTITCDHNHVRRELHEGQELWVHRKGAQRVDPNEYGIVPGSMGSPSYHVEGRGVPEALCSAAHGAGRAMSRGDARRRIRVKDLDRQMRGVWFDARLCDALCEEAPSAYKPIADVMRAQHELVRVVRRLEPVLVYKAV